MDIERICSICLAAQENPLKLERCVHEFCSDCITQWLDVKNNCPLCLNLIGDKPAYNKLQKEAQQSTSFDNESLVFEFEEELRNIDQTMKYLDGRIKEKRKEAKNFKSHFPSTSLQFVEEQILSAYSFYDILQEAVLTNDKPNSSFYLQKITQILLRIESVLSGGPISHEYEDGEAFGDYYDECEYSDESDDQKEYMNEEIEDMICLKNMHKEKARAKKAASSSNQGGNSTAKTVSAKAKKN